jgi:hypothetical protein
VELALELVLVLGQLLVRELAAMESVMVLELELVAVLEPAMGRVTESVAARALGLVMALSQM